MADAFLIASIVILSVLLMGVVILVVVVFGHPDDRNEAYFPRAVVIFSFWIAFASILVMPYDVANSAGGGGGIRVDILWQIIYWCLAILVCVLIPFAYFFYESDVDEKEVKGFCDSQLGQAISYTFGFFAVMAVLLVILYSFLHTAEIPVVRYRETFFNLVLLGVPNQRIPNPSLGTCELAEGCIYDTYIWQIDVTFPVFLMAFLSFIGWFFWTFFVGVGMVALPMDLINEFRTRPEPMKTTEYFAKREALGRRAEALIKAGEQMQRNNEDNAHMKRGRSAVNSDANLLRRFEQAYYLLKRDKELLEACAKLRGVNFSTDSNVPLNLNPLWYILKLVFGVLSIGLSVSWVLHICIFQLPRRPAHPFLNNMFIALTEVGGGGFPLFGVCAFAFYGVYLLMTAIKGNFKLGLRLAFWKIFPMEVGKTKMSAFLANSWIILLCSVPSVQFCVDAFPLYARETQVDILFGSQVQHMRGLKYFWENNVFVLAMLCVVFITAIWMIARPKDEAANIEAELQALAAQPLGQP